MKFSNEFVRQKGFSAIVVILGMIVLILLGGGIYYFGKSQISKSPIPDLAPASQTSQITSTPSSINSVTPKTSIIKLLDNKIPADSSTFVKGGSAICQPEFFDPKTAKFHKVKYNDDEGYVLDGSDSDVPQFNINGWYKEDENKINLPSPFKVTVYNFGCASSFSDVLDLSKNGLRQALYTHTLNWSISSDKSNLYIVNNLKNSKGEWELLKRIINIVNNKATKLPNLDCVDQGKWDGDKLITYSDKNKDLSDKKGVEYQSQYQKYQTQVCVWNNEGKLLSKLEGNLDWYGASKDSLWSKIGFLPKDSNIFYVYKTGFKTDPPQCQLYLQDLTNQNRWKMIDLFTRNNPSGLLMCPYNIKFDFTDTTFENPVLKYDNVDKD